MTQREGGKLCRGGIEACARYQYPFRSYLFVSPRISLHLPSLSWRVLSVLSLSSSLSLSLSLSLLSTPSIVPAPPRPTVYRSFFRLRCDIYLEVSTMGARGPRRHLHDLFRRRNNVSTLVGPGDRSITGARREFSLSLSPRSGARLPVRARRKAKVS